MLKFSAAPRPFCMHWASQWTDTQAFILLHSLSLFFSWISSVVIWMLLRLAMTKFELLTWISYQVQPPLFCSSWSKAQGSDSATWASLDLLKKTVYELSSHKFELIFYMLDWQVAILICSSWILRSNKIYLLVCELKSWLFTHFLHNAEW